ncbi:MAG: PEP-CTERM sorting domain-containing protein [Planctomycetes bacterium]|nr:PEP-CTERM sorting domain-containing protein [Planctomycetota bacterium]
MIMRSFLRMGLLALVCGAIFPLHVEAAHVILDPSGADSVLLSDLLNGDVVGVVVGDKIFDDFSYSTLPGDDMPDPANINVLGFQDLDGNWGISFHGAFIDLPGNGPSDALLRFTVGVTQEAIDQGWRISDAHLFAGGVGLGEDSFLSIDESFQENNETLNVFATTLGGPLEQELSDGVDFDELYTSLRVTKDIFALAGDTNQIVRTTAIDQSFSQVQIGIPEPTTFGLMLAGLAVAGVLRRRRLEF